MLIWEACRMSVKSVRGNKMRSFLTMLGIIIGVMALVVLVSVANGTTENISDSISSLGTNTLTVRISDDKGSPLTLSGLNELVADLDSIEDVSATGSASVTAYSSYSKNYSSDSETEDATVTGTSSGYADIQGLTIENGRYFNSTDVDNHTNVVVISADLAEDIMGSTNCIGSTIKFDGIPYEIIGVLESSDSSTSSMRGGRSGSSSYRSYEAYIPYTSLLRLSDQASSEVTSFVVSAVDENSMDSAELELENALLSRFQNDSDAFSIQNQSEIAEAMADVQSTMTIMLGGIAAISLLVGGIGIMNIMLVSVTERTREIGIRKSIGAGQGVIMFQFLIEALILSLMGCFVGILGSWAAIRIIGLVAGTTYSMSMPVVWAAIAFSSVIGIGFGLYPAWKAARKNPIEALRYF